MAISLSCVMANRVKRAGKRTITSSLIRLFTAGASGGDAIFGPLDYEASLEMRAEHMEHPLARGGDGIEALLQQAEFEPTRLEAFNGHEQFLERAPEPVEPIFNTWVLRARRKRLISLIVKRRSANM